MAHYASMIRSHGSAGGYNTEASERLHIDFAKVAYNASNKKGYIKQMTTWMRRREAVEKFQRFLQYSIDEYSEPEEQEEDDDEGDDVDVDGNTAGSDRDSITNIVPTIIPTVSADDHDDDTSANDVTAAGSALEYGEAVYSIPKTAAYTNVTIDDLQTKFGASDFVYAMEAFLRERQLLKDDYWDAAPATYSVYKRFRVTVPPTPEVSAFPTIDPIRATLPEPARGHKKGKPAHFDTVLARKDLPEDKSIDLDLLGPKGVYSRSNVLLCIEPF